MILIVAMVILSIIFSLTAEEFLTPLNLGNIFTQSIPIMIIAFGMTVIIISGGIDLSVGAIVSVVGVSTVWLLESADMPAGIAMLIGLGVGGLVGLINGTVVTFLRVPDFVATLAMMSTARGMAYVISNGFAIRSTDPTLAFLYNGSVEGLRFPIIVAALAFIVVYILLGHTALGRAFYAIGGNRDAAQLAGLKVRRLVILAYMIGALLTALSALLTTSRNAAGSPTIGSGWELQAIAIVIVGGANLFGGEGSVVGTLLACLMIGMINNWMSLMGLTWWLDGLLQGSLLIFVVAVGYRSYKRRHAVVRTPDEV